ncbi:MAG: hypothetical protein HY535_03040 [Chloroflexi bacterium]|nr:hypothetical protein [Chloroflexota bacterium]
MTTKTFENLTVEPASTSLTDPREDQGEPFAQTEMAPPGSEAFPRERVKETSNWIVREGIVTGAVTFTTIPRVTLDAPENLATQAGGYEPLKSLPRKGAIQPLVDRDARQLLVGELSRAQHILLPVIVSKTNECRMPLKKIEWSVKSNPEEKWREVVCRVFVAANAPQALAFWDAVGEAIHNWRMREKPLVQRLLDEQVAVFVEWE